jgi:FkbM family methyltransferase
MRPLERVRRVGHQTSNDVKRVIQTLTRFDNGFRVLGDIVWRRTEELTYVTDGLEIVCPNRGGARFAVYELFADDAYQLRWFTRGLRKDAVVLDLGGHIGSFSLAISQLFPQAHVDAYEPTPFTAGYLRRNVELNGLSDRLRVFESAVSARPGVLVMAIMDDGSAHNGVMLSGAPGTSSIEVPSTGLDDVFAEAPGPVDLIKFDIEGAEYEAILESSRDLWQPVQRVVMEYHRMPGRSWADLETFFASVGLEVVRRDEHPGEQGMAWLSRGQL